MLQPYSSKLNCSGCEACAQICGKSAITMTEDKEGFRYPVINQSLCVECGLCAKICPNEHSPERYKDNKSAFGGYIKNEKVRVESTSGGAFSAIVDAWCDDNYVIFGAETRGLEVFHSYIDDKTDLATFRKSKYTQSHIGNTYIEAKQFLKEGKKVLFSGTPCQIAGLMSFLQKTDTAKLLTIEVICEGVPSPLYVWKKSEYVKNTLGYPIESIDYRDKDGNKWDYQVMSFRLVPDSNCTKSFKQDRWFNPFWSIWLQHLMSRPSCYYCKYTNTARVADLSLGDLWGVHIYCPELYGHNKGASLIFANTEKGKNAVDAIRPLMYGHDIAVEDAIRFQSPMKKCIPMNEKRSEFMNDLLSMDYEVINKKWAKKTHTKTLIQKYIWGKNSQVVFWKNIKKKLGI